MLALMQDVEGVEAADLDALHLSSDKASLEARLPARTAEWNDAHSAIRAGELLLVNPREIQLTEMSNRVWKRTAEYNLILTERRRLGI